MTSYGHIDDLTPPTSRLFWGVSYFPLPQRVCAKHDYGLKGVFHSEIEAEITVFS